MRSMYQLTGSINKRLQQSVRLALSKLGLREQQWNVSRTWSERHSTTATEVLFSSCKVARLVSFLSFEMRTLRDPARRITPSTSTVFTSNLSEGVHKSQETEACLCYPAAELVMQANLAPRAPRLMSNLDLS